MAKVYLDDYLDSLERKIGVSRSSLASKKYGTSLSFSTGALSLDLILGGGIPYGRFVVWSGLESSGKSTILYNILVNLLKDPKYEKTLFLFFDQEGTLTLDYLRMMSGLGRYFDELFEKRVRYYALDTGDEVMQIVHNILRMLPKIVQEDGRWWEVYPKTLPKKLLEALMSTCDKEFYRKTGLVRVAIPEPYPTAVIFIDSLAAMFPSSMEDSMDSNKPATKASMFSNWLPAIVPKMVPRMATIIATNQIRERPMTMFGSPFYEPGGNALKFYSDIRIKINACSIPHGKGRLEEIGANAYTYSKAETIKNKVFPPFRSTYVRIWALDEKGRCRGLDPVWDTITYLKETGQIAKKRGKDLYLLSLPGFENVSFTEEELYACILEPIKLFTLKKLEPPNEKIAYLAEAYKVSEFLTRKQREYVEQFSIREACRKQLQSGKAFNLYFKE